MSKIKNPSVKKAKSYAHDRRNTYGEAPHAARKSIPRGKARAHRAERREVHQALELAERIGLDEGAVGSAETAIVESKLQRLGGFQKQPDTPLRTVVASKKERRVSGHGAKKARALARSHTRPTK